MLFIPDFRKAYGEKLILEAAGLKFAPGLYWIKGANGSGKSTFFKSICGIIPFEGDCELDGVSLKRNPVAYRRKISYCEAEPVYPEFTTLNDLMHFTGKAKKAPAGRAEELIDELGLGDFIHQPVRTYSSGMLKKTGLALALLGDSDVVCLDEPFITVDRQSLEHVVRLIRRYHDRHGMTFLISSHVEDPDARLPYRQLFEIKDRSILESAD